MVKPNELTSCSARVTVLSRLAAYDRRPMAMPPNAERPGPASAAPSLGVRVLAFAAILIAGACGGLIGYAVVDLQCDGNCALGKGLGAIVGAVGAATGVAVIAVLTLRAMGEWAAGGRPPRDRRS